MKRISVIVTCSNLEKYLDECIDSIKQQILVPHEIILIHDGCKEAAKAYDGVTTVFLTKNVGVAKARDIGFKISTGDYIVFFDGDDVMPYNYLMQMAHTDADVVYPSCVMWVAWGNSGVANVWHEAPDTIKLEKMLVRNEVIMPSLFKREWYDNVGGFDETLELFEDYDFWLKILTNGGKFKKSCAFMYYRQRTQSRNHKNEDKKQEIYNKIIQKFTLNTKKPSKV